MPGSNNRPSSGKGAVIGVGAVYLGFISIGVGLYYDISIIAIAVGLALIAAGIAIYTITSIKSSNRQMQAMSNLVFHEKIAIIQS